ncbi:16S rRNA (cytidine(1402)-2'-O)-methyltransferase [Amphritea balenae]|uniref:Ribosomal RNA small subunit methyltransferase I n=1 Tax=Amphritea balenae TaxID=452629 RepID=A0A3P1SSM5_9GAMM|nr:16S rRNA (cytidine(1402)-2'-O)-methyltransferase [Amphritea balenae]RRD00138.1 16S rRNA (cytidine(1402)-2'-O)-methyltransferase [Amphritea balenae]GGK76958.1 ribosomal RNA small subunit methyltransferase I [Amphritea balenae]
MSESVLYVIATPIGNLEDMTPRALRILESVALIAAEDTRHSGRLLSHFNIKTPMIAVHDHNERQQQQKIIEKLQQGLDIALISDAGTPLISDPGFVLVREVRAAGFNVVPVPGCCAMVAALSAAGVPSDRFAFEGFPPAKSQQRLNFFSGLAAETRTLMFYESPHRILDSLAAVVEAFGADRPIVIARELTKTFETFIAGTAAEVLSKVEADPNQRKGEFVLMVEGAPEIDDSDLDSHASEVLDILLAELSVKQASALAAKITGVKKKVLYQAALDRK